MTETTDTGSGMAESMAPDVMKKPDAAPDAPPPCTTTCPVSVYYFNPMPATPSSSIDLDLEIDNTGTATLDLTNVTVRYWFLAQGDPPSSLDDDCYYAMINCSSVTMSFVSMATPTATADTYLEVSFTGGSVAAASNSGEIQLAIHDASYAINFNQTTDYSYNGTFATFTQWNQITAYQGGTLVWGTEP